MALMMGLMLGVGRADNVSVFVVPMWLVWGGGVGVGWVGGRLRAQEREHRSF